MDMREFLEQSLGIELISEASYHRLAGLALANGDTDASAFFTEMAEYARLHRESIQRAAGMDVTPIPSPGSADTEIPDLRDGRAEAALTAAMEIALAAEMRGVDFYANIAARSTDAQIREMARTFASEEQGHVLALRRFMGLKAY